MNDQNDRKAMQDSDAVKRSSQLLTAAVITLFIAVFSISSCQATFVNSDEAYIAQVLSGCFTEKPINWAPFLSPVLSYGFRVLYGLAPGIAWYAWTQRLLMIAALAIINYCVLDRMARCLKGNSLAVGGLICLGTDMMLCWALTRMSVYYTVAIGGSAAVCLFAWKGFDGKRFWLRGVPVLLIFSACIGFLPLLGIGLLCQLLLSVVLWGKAHSKLYADNRAMTRRTVAFVVLIVVLFIANISVFFTMNRQMGGQQYLEWESLRRAYARNASIPYPVNEGVYRKVKWTREFHFLPPGHYFMDDRFNASALSQVLKNRRAVSRTAALLGPVEAVSGSADTGAPIMGLTLIAHGFLLLNIVLSWKKRRRELIVPSIYLLLLDLIWWLLHRRWSLAFPEALVFTAPWIFLMADAAIGGIDPAARITDHGARLRGCFRKYGSGMLLALVSCAVILGGCFVFKGGTEGILTKDRIDRVYATERAFEGDIRDYAREHRDRTLVYHWSMLSTFDPFQTPKRGDLYNLFCDNMVGAYSVPFTAQLRMNGLRKPLRSPDFAGEDVRFATADQTIAERLLAFLSDTYGINYCVVEEKSENGVLFVRYLKEYDPYRLMDASDLPVQAMKYRNSKIIRYDPPQGALLPADAKVSLVRQHAFTVRYHLQAEAEASDRITEVLRDQKTPILTCEELDFAVPGSRFTGWTLYWPGANAWYVQDGKGKKKWVRELSEGEEYVRIKDGSILNNTIPEGDELHLYAQWEKKELTEQKRREAVARLRG